MLRQRKYPPFFSTRTEVELFVSLKQQKFERFLAHLDKQLSHTRTML